MELNAVFKALNEALEKKDMEIYCQSVEIQSLKKKVEELENKLEPKNGA